MNRWPPVTLAAAVGAVLLAALLLTLREGLIVAPRAEKADDGRLLLHMKNITRFGGDAEAVRWAVWRAVYLEEAPPRTADAEANWQETILAHVQPDSLPRHVVVLPAEGEEALAWALPGAYWAVYAGSPVIFAARDELGAAAARQVQGYGLPVYVLAPEALISPRTFQQLTEIAPTRRLAGDDLAEHAVRIATYRDVETGFGWGRAYDERDGYFHYVMAVPSEAEHALAGLPLARSNAAALLFAGDDGGLPPPTERYVWQQRADWFVTPAEGPFRHFWVLGDRLSYAAQGRLDLSVEKADYPARGPVALGPMEGLVLVYIVLGIAGFLFVLLHGARLLPEVMLPVRVAWAFTALLVPVIGMVLYLAAYRRPRLNPGEDRPRWLRPPSIQSAAATAMGFGYGAPLMIVIGWFFLYFGLPLFYGPWADGWQFLFGAGMPIMMAAMYVLAVLLAWPLAQLPIMQVMMDQSAEKVAKRTLGVVTLSMAAVSLGMMTGAWWLLMWKAPMMPVEDDILWFGLMWVASTAGFLVAWPLNYPMVRAKLKMGGV